MSLKDEIKKAIGEEAFKTLESKVKLGEFIPVEKFNEKLDLIKDLQSDKETLLKDKSELEQKNEESKNANLSDIEKLQKNVETLIQSVENEKKTRLEAEESLKSEKLTNSIKGKLIKADMKPKFIDKYVEDFKSVNENEFDTKLKEFAEDNKELFGKEIAKGKTPEGNFKDNDPDGLPEAKSFAEWKEQIEKM